MLETRLKAGLLAIIDTVYVYGLEVNKLFLQRMLVDSPPAKDWFDVRSCMSGPLGINLPVKAGVVYVGRPTLNVFKGLVLPIFFSANQDSHPFAVTIPAFSALRDPIGRRRSHSDHLRSNCHR